VQKGFVRANVSKGSACSHGGGGQPNLSPFPLASAKTGSVAMMHIKRHNSKWRINSTSTLRPIYEHQRSKIPTLACVTLELDLSHLLNNKSFRSSSLSLFAKKKSVAKRVFQHISSKGQVKFNPIQMFDMHPFKRIKCMQLQVGTGLQLLSINSFMYFFTGSNLFQNF
jgi:hypothetical protein